MSEYLAIWAPTAGRERLLAAAERISPRVQIVGDGLAVLDFTGLTGLHGSAEAAALQLQSELGTPCRWGIAAHPAPALLAAKCGLGRLPEGREAEHLAPLPLAWLADLDELTHGLASPEEVAEALELFERWGLRTFGDLARLPADGVAARLGGLGRHLRGLASSTITGLLDTPPQPERRRRASGQFEPPIEDLERLKAALGGEIAMLTAALEQHDEVVEAVELRLELERRTPVFCRLAFAAPTRERRTLEAQIELAVERIDFSGGSPAISGFELTMELTRPRRVQSRLFAAALPDRAKLPKLLGLLSELYGGPAQVGSPQLLDSDRPQAFTMQAYAPPADEDENTAPPQPRDVPLALRIYRPLRRLEIDPARITRRAGPWRSQGDWWVDTPLLTLAAPVGRLEPWLRSPAEDARSARDIPKLSGTAWACDEWDAELPTGLYRLLHDHRTDAWYVLGQYD